MQDRCEFLGRGLAGLAKDTAVRSQRRGFLDLKAHVLGQVRQGCAVGQVVFDLGGEFGDGGAALVLGQLLDQFGACLFQRLAGIAVNPVDPDEQPAQRRLERSGNLAGRCGEHGIGRIARALQGKGGLFHAAEVGNRQALGPGRRFKRLAARDFGRNCLRRRLGGEDKLRKLALVGRCVLRLVGVIQRGDFGIGAGGHALQHVVAKGDVADRAAFGQGIVALAAIVPAGDFRLARRSGRCEGGGGKSDDCTLAPLENHGGIAHRNLRRQAQAKLVCPGQLTGNQVFRDFLAELGIGHAAFGEELAVKCRIDLAIGSLDAGDLGDLAVDQAVADVDAVALAPLACRLAVNQVGKQVFQAIAAQESGHVCGRVLLAHPAEDRLDRAFNLGVFDLFLADLGQGGLPSHRAQSAHVRHVAAGKGKSDQRDEAKGHGDPPFGLEKTAERLKHCSLARK